MKFGKKKPSGLGDQAQKRQLRKNIWDDPTIIENLFGDEAWERFDAGHGQDSTPKTKMATHIQQAIDQEQISKVKEEHHTVRSLRIYRYAVAATILLLLSFSFWKAQQNNPITRPVASNQAATKVLRQLDSSWITVANSSAETKTVTLPDQSSAKLFAHTTLRYLRNFTIENRIVYLEGKAYFSVQADPKRPFSVYAGQTKTTALGTSFTINSQTAAKHTSVELHTGKVVVASLSKIPAFEDILLNHKGESLLFNTVTQLVAHKRASKQNSRTAQTPDQDLATEKEVLRLENIPLNQVFAALHKAYAVKIHCNTDQVAKIQYTGVIDPAHENLKDVLTVICLINDLRYEVETDGSYTIYSVNNNTTKTEQTN